MHSREGGIHGNPEAATTQTPNPRVLEKEGPGKRENGTSDSKTPSTMWPACTRKAQKKKKKNLALTQSQSRLRANRAAMLAEGKDVDVLSQ